MSDFLTAVKSVQRQKDEPAEPFLTEIKTAKPQHIGKQSTSSIAHEKTRPNRTTVPTAHDHAASSTGESAESTTATLATHASLAALARTPEETLRLLRSEPSAPALSALLQQLSSKDPFEQTGAGGRFSLHSPGPIQAKIINVLLNTIIPTFWPTLGTTGKALLIACLTNVAGVSAIVARLRYLSLQAKNANAKAHAPTISITLDVADHTFRGDGHVSRISIGLETAGIEKINRDLAWKEYVNLIGSGKVISAAAEAEDLLNSISEGNTSRISKPRCWLSDGAGYASWLGKNAASSLFTNAAFTASIGQLLTKALTLGYPITLLRGLYTELLRTALHVHSRRNDFLKGLVEAMPGYARVQLLERTLRWLSTLVASDEHLEAPSSAGLQGVEMSPSRVDHEVSAMAALLDALLKDNATLQIALANILSDPVQNATVSHPVRRASIAVLASRVPETLQTAVMGRTMTTFGDKLFINHAPVLQQESLAQTILLAAGYSYRQNLGAGPLRVIVKSAGHMQDVSNRLEASGGRARWLGMVIGTALSGLVDKDGGKLGFGTQEMRTREAEWYLDLTGVQDTMSSLNEFEALLHRRRKLVTKPKGRVGINKMKLEAMPKLNGKPLFGPVPPPTLAQTEVEGEKVSEVLDEESDEDEGLVRYAKPDSDPEDSDEDATLVNRRKPANPVYIRDLMAMLRDSGNAERFQMGICSAAELVRRKMGFGREVADHKEELAGILCGLQDLFGTEGFEERRLQGLIAVLLSDVGVMAPWFSRQAFTGEYSLAQRCVILTSLGLGGRELAGMKDEDELNPHISNIAFPSKRLPPRLEAVYNQAQQTTRRLESATKDVEHALIKPLALSAADKQTAHLNAVKVRTFSSRMEVERTKRKPTPNSLAKLFGSAFFFPLVNRYQQDIAAYGNGSTYSSAPFLLVTFLKTLALLLHASGPATLGLEQVTTEFWELLLSLRVQAVADVSVLEAVLFALLTLLEVNGHNKRRLAEEHAYSLMETKEWVELVFERTGGGGLVDDGGGSNQEAKVRALAAGVLVRTTEVIEAYQQELMGRG